MRPADALGMSAGNLGRRKGRTALTLVGVVIGVAALVLMISLAVGLEREVLKLFQSEDTLRTIFISRVKPGARKGQKKPNLFDFGMQSVPITDRDIAELRKLPGVAHVVPDINLFLSMEIDGEADSEEEFIPIGGLPPEEIEGMRKYLLAGDLWTDPNERAVLIPSRLLQVRFEKRPQDIVGKKVVFSRAFTSDDDPQLTPEQVTFRVAGVLDTEKLGIKARQLFVPMERALELRDLTQGGNAPLLVYKKGSYLSAEVKTKDMNSVEELKRQLGNSGYQVLTSADILGTVRTIFLVIEGFMACIGAIGLVVSIFGIANTMAMAVLERTREIGIMKAIGARNGDVRVVFLLEAAAIGLIGGIVGLGAGAIGGVALDAVAHGLTDVPDDVRLFHVSPLLAAGAVLFSIFVSALAGFVPAMRASRMDPVTALRYE